MNLRHRACGAIAVLVFLAAGITWWLVGRGHSNSELPGSVIRRLDDLTRVDNIQISGDWAAWMEAHRVRTQSHATPYNYSIVRIHLPSDSLEVLFKTKQTIPQYFRRPLIHLESDGRLLVKHWGLDDTGKREVYPPGASTTQPAAFPEEAFRRMEEEGTDRDQRSALPDMMTKVFAEDWPYGFSVVHVSPPYVYLSGQQAMLYRYDPLAREVTAMGTPVPPKACYSHDHSLILTERQIRHVVLSRLTPLSKEEDDARLHTREIDKAIRAAEHDLDAGVNAKWSHLIPASINNMYQKCGYRSIPVYARMLAEGKVNAVRSTVANQLCLLGDPRCLPPLVQKLTSDDDWVSADVVGFMPMMPHRAVVTAIAPLLHDQENWMKAVHILSHTSDRELIPELAALAKIEGDGVRQEMIEKAMESIQRQAQARDAAMESWKSLQNKSMQATPNGAPDG